MSSARPLLPLRLAVKVKNWRMNDSDFAEAKPQAVFQAALHFIYEFGIGFLFRVFVFAEMRMRLVQTDNIAEIRFAG